ncbi:hypothetical protein COO60DRAFT_652127 [Scenedesmus sp. NREL 46B-D3]|nr:hypothetical protein COO60DRAFT_652127 [Scenedesmus sp. NREL 46B-D3]
MLLGRRLACRVVRCCCLPHYSLLLRLAAGAIAAVCEKQPQQHHHHHLKSTAGLAAGSAAVVCRLLLMGCVLHCSTAQAAAQRPDGCCAADGRCRVCSLRWLRLLHGSSKALLACICLLRGVTVPGGLCSRNAALVQGGQGGSG